MPPPDRRDRPRDHGALPRAAAPACLAAAAVAVALAAVAPRAAPAQQPPRAPEEAAPGPDPTSWVDESWTVRDGLPVNSISDIVQDRAGYIWAATFDGLVRFDGVRFTVFNSANSDGLPSNRITSLAETGDGALWLTTEQGRIVRFREGRFTDIPFEGGREEGPATLIEGAGGTIWVGTTQGLWTLRRDRLERVGLGTLEAPVSAIVQRRDGSLWVGTDGAGVYRVTGGGRVERLAGEPALDADLVTRMFEDSAGTLWVAGMRALWRWRDGPRQVRGPPAPFRAFDFAQVPATGELFASATSGIYRLESDSAVRVRPPPRSGGLTLWSDTDVLWTVHGQEVLRDGERSFTLPGVLIVSAILFDREGSLWIGTDAGGLHRLKPALFTTYRVSGGSAYPNVYATYVDHAGGVWLGMWGNGASRLDPVTGRATPLRTRKALGSVNSFYEDGAGRLWVGAGEQDGLYLCTPPAMRCDAAGPPEVRHRSVFALHGEADGDLWVGATSLLLRYHGQRWTSFPPSSGAPAATVRAFARTSDGALWMGTNGGGLARFRDGRFTAVTSADGLPSDLVRSLYQDADGWLWVGTEGRGLARLDPRAWGEGGAPAGRSRSIVRIGSNDGLFDEVIHQILEDDAGRLWMNTNRGIFWVVRSELLAFADGRATRVHSTAYAERDGIGNREGNGGVQPAGARGPDGRLWFPTQDGVVVVDPAQVRRDSIAPPLVVEQVVAGGHVLLPGRDSMKLGPDERDVQVNYTALTFLEPLNVGFRHRLDPYDARWVDVGNRRTAYYTKVPPGRYTFRVQVSDAAGGWYEPGVAVPIEVLPRLWETAAFRWTAAAAAALLLLVAIRLREAGLRARAARLEEVVGERTWALREREHELAERNAQLQLVDRSRTRFFANVSHELRTPLTLTIGPLEDLRARAGGDPQVERWLDIALRNARRLLRLVNQILDVAKLEAGALRLSPRPLDLVPFSRGVIAAFAPVAEQRGLSVEVETPGALTGSFDADAVEKVLTNLLSNAIKFTPDGGSVHVALSDDGGAARLVVRNSGPGIPPEQAAHVFERFYQAGESTTRMQPGTGIGLSLVKELVELHGGTVAVESGSTSTAFSARIPPVAPDGSAVPRGGAATADRVAGPQPVAPSAATIAAAVASMADHPPDAGKPAAADGREVDARGADAPGDDVPTLLVVDDSADLRRYIRDHFAARFRVIEAADGGEGVALARQHLPDVVLSDVMMPVVDGYELVRTLRGSSETDFLAIVLLTAQAGDGQRLDGLERGADEYLVKPFEMRELDIRMRNLIASRRRLCHRFAGVGPPAAVSAAVVPAGVTPADAAYMARVREAIRDGLGDPDFGVGALADAVAQDRSHLFRRVRQLFGESPSDLLRHARLAEGERLLREGSATVTDVAYAVGFNSLSYFCRCFHEAYGTTPAAYRERSAVPHP